MELLTAGGSHIGGGRTEIATQCTRSVIRLVVLSVRPAAVSNSIWPPGPLRDADRRGALGCTSGLTGLWAFARATAAASVSFRNMVNGEN